MYDADNDDDDDADDAFVKLQKRIILRFSSGSSCFFASFYARSPTPLLHHHAFSHFAVVSIFMQTQHIGRTFSNALELGFFSPSLPLYIVASVCHIIVHMELIDREVPIPIQNNPN